MKNKVRVFLNLAFSLGDQIVVSACTFLTMILVTQNCSKTSVGIYALTGTILNLTRTAQERLISAPYLAFRFQPKFDRPSYQGSSMAHQVVFSILATVLTWVLAAVFTLVEPESDWPIAFLCLGISMPWTLFRDQVRYMMAARFQIRSQLFYDLTISIGQIVLLLVFANQLLLNVPTVYLLTGVACLLPSLVWIWWQWNGIRLERSQIISDWIHNWGYAKWLLLARVFGILGYFIVPWIVYVVRSEEETAGFAVCNSLIGVSMMFVTGLNNYLAPRTIQAMQHRGTDAMFRSVWQSVALVSVVLMGVSIVIYFWGDLLLLKLFGEEYAQYGWTAFLLSLSTLSVSASTFFGNGLASLGQSKYYFWGEFACCVVSIGAACILVPTMELTGASVSLILGGLASTIVTAGTLFVASGEQR